VELMSRKKKPMFLSKQYRHQRALAKEGKGAKFGSYTYTATDLNEKGVSRISNSSI
jgi:Ras GTPase-activating-like protein IQGAP2/3